MKRICVLLISAVLMICLASCSDNLKNTSVSAETLNNPAEETIKVEKVNLQDYGWNEASGCYEGNDCIPDAQTAVSIAEVYLDQVYGKSIVDAQKPFHVQVDNDLGVWIIYGDVGEQVGGDIMIALNRKDGRVLQIMTEE